MDKNFDIVIIGSGPGGYVTAIRAAQLGYKTAIIERESLGGVCLNWGCIPTKALLKSAEVYTTIKNAKNYGIDAIAKSPDMAVIIKRSRDVANQLSSGVAFLLKKNKIEVIMGTGSLSSASSIDVKTIDGKIENIKAKHIIIATGARARILSGIEPDGELIWAYRDALVAKELPKKILIVGSGAIGLEFASFFNSLGSEVTVVEQQAKILNTEDDEIIALAHKSFEKQGMKILTNTKIVSTIKNGKTLIVKLDANGETITLEVDKLLSAVGVISNIENLGLEKLGIKIEKGSIQTDGYGKTNVPGVYAIGDVTPGPWLAHKASHEGVICIEAIANLKPHALNKSRIPGCIYTHPQVASVGLTEAKARELKIDIKVGKFPFIGNGKAIAIGESEGLVKTIFNAKTGELLGAHMIGAEVTELIATMVISMNLETTQDELIATVFAHPTISEGIHESVLGSIGKMVHF